MISQVCQTYKNSGLIAALKKLIVSFQDVIARNLEKIVLVVGCNVDHQKV